MKFKSLELLYNTLPFSYIMFKSLNNFLIFLSKIWLILVKNIRHIETVKSLKSSMRDLH